MTSIQPIQLAYDSYTNMHPQVPLDYSNQECQIPIHLKERAFLSEEYRAK